MANTTVKSEDYAKLLKAYDGKDTFFFLDPPYEDPGKHGFGYAKGSKYFDFDRLRETLARVKGHWLMTINDSPRIRTLFKGYTIHPIIIKGHKANRVSTDDPGRRHVGSEDRPELLISNYPLPRGWQEHTGPRILKA
jgi:DNA adenine methylase